MKRPQKSRKVRDPGDSEDARDSENARDSVYCRDERDIGDSRDCVYPRGQEAFPAQEEHSQDRDDSRE